MQTMQKPNWVLWFVQTIREFGGEYVPFRLLDDKKKEHTDGRRELRRDPYPLSEKKYYTDKHGAVRRAETR